MISTAHAETIAKRERAVFVMAKKAGGFRYGEIIAAYPGLFTKNSQFNNFMRKLVNKSSDLEVRVTKGGANAYYLLPNLYKSASKIWDVHAADVHNIA